MNTLPQSVLQGLGRRANYIHRNITYLISSTQEHLNNQSAGIHAVILQPYRFVNNTPSCHKDDSNCLPTRPMKHNIQIAHYLLNVHDAIHLLLIGVICKEWVLKTSFKLRWSLSLWSLWLYSLYLYIKSANAILESKQNITKIIEITVAFWN